LNVSPCCAGLIHANHGGEITEYILTQLKDATTDIVRHGACLGIGLAAMGTARQDVYEQLKVHLYQDDAITGARLVLLLYSFNCSLTFL